LKADQLVAVQLEGCSTASDLQLQNTFSCCRFVSQHTSLMWQNVSVTSPHDLQGKAPQSMRNQTTKRRKFKAI